MLFALLACTDPTTSPDDTGDGVDDSDAVGETGDTADTADTADSGEDAAPTRGLWVWDTDIPFDDEETAELVAFATAQGTTTLFMNCDPVGYGLDGATEAYASFVDAAHDAGLEVFGMSGYGWFTVPCDAGLQGQPTCWDEGWGVYEACAASGLFDGIMDDSESHSVAPNHWENHYEQRSRWAIQFLQGVRERIGDLPLHHAMPAWYDAKDPITMTDDGEARTLDVWVAETVDVAAVMSYRDDADSVLEITETERGNGPIWMGLEICNAGEGDSVDFSEEGSAAMVAATEALEAAMAGDPAFVGVMHHSYGCWRSAAP